ncbi:hypothetical protein [Actinobaculum sp. 352]|uniref:hypothetical protein n=1 Tax=Actinobaculum sp. 352 TaxID=2490946 RepID=UPI000F7F8F25|nr:hypothetical protein [Actinobaculum sp. 352]RTE49617.1 hypothetical protein EKN07_06120 [Actinobaculum sp. 352]
MPVYYVTFGAKYADEPHPINPLITDRSVAIIQAGDETLAHKAAFHHFDQHWSRVIPQDEGEQYTAAWDCHIVAYIIGHSIVWAVNADAMTSPISNTQEARGGAGHGIDG